MVMPICDFRMITKPVWVSKTYGVYTIKLPGNLIRKYASITYLCKTAVPIYQHCMQFSISVLVFGLIKANIIHVSVSSFISK